MKEKSDYIYPVPKYIKLKGNRVKSSDVLLDKSRETMKAFDISFLEKNDNNIEVPYKLGITIKKLREFSSDGISELIDINDETFAIKIKNKNLEIYGDNYRSINYAFNTLNKMLEKGYIYEDTTVLDYPDMKVRGIIEGFYGRPWSFKERCEAVSTISKHNMNSYIYAPKNDSYHRNNWREHYPKQELNKIKKLFQHCRKCSVDFYYTLSPGLSIKYSDEGDMCKLHGKYMQLYDMGVRHFGILFDDIPNELIYDEDKSKFKSINRAHIETVCRLYEFLKHKDKTCQLIVCPTIYNGRGNEEYISELGNNIPNEVQLFWTGRSICSQELDTRDAKYFYENTGHKPLYWDNYPVNDALMEYEMHLGPIIGRDKDLFKYSMGLISNVMEYKEASMIPVITIAHYLWNSTSYDSSVSMNAAVSEISGTKDSVDFMRFASYCLKSCLNPVSSDEFINKAVQLRYATSKGEISQILNELENYFQGNLFAGVRLLHGMKNKKLRKDIKKWLQKYIDFNKLCIDIIRCVKYFHQGKKLKSSLFLIKALSLAGELNKNPIQMMNFETKALVSTLKESVKSRPKL